MDGDVVLVPEGYHPVGVPAGYDCYYLNVMAGPNRAWYFTLDPDHAWLMNWSPPRRRPGRRRTVTAARGPGSMGLASQLSMIDYPVRHDRSAAAAGQQPLTEDS